MPFEVSTITNKGLELLAASTTSDRFIVDGCDASTMSPTVDTAKRITSRPPASTRISNTTSITELGSTKNLLSCRAYFVAGTNEGGDAYSLFLYGHLQSQPDSIYVIYVVSNSTSFHLPEEGDITNEWEIVFNITYNTDTEAAVAPTQATYATSAEFNYLEERVVTTHKLNQPTDGDNQDIYGYKKFKQTAWFDSNIILPVSDNEYGNDLVISSSRGVVYHDYEDETDNRLQLNYDVTESDTTTKGIRLMADLEEELSASCILSMLNSSHEGGGYYTNEILLSTNDIFYTRDTYSYISISTDRDGYFDGEPYSNIHIGSQREDFNSYIRVGDKNITINTCKVVPNSSSLSYPGFRGYININEYQDEEQQTQYAGSLNFYTVRGTTENASLYLGRDYNSATEVDIARLKNKESKITIESDSVNIHSNDTAILEGRGEVSVIGATKTRILTTVNPAHSETLAHTDLTLNWYNVLLSVYKNSSRFCNFHYEINEINSSYIAQFYCDGGVYSSSLGIESIPFDDLYVRNIHGVKLTRMNMITEVPIGGIVMAWFTTQNSLLGPGQDSLWNIADRTVHVALLKYTNSTMSWTNDSSFIEEGTYEFLQGVQTDHTVTGIPVLIRRVS